jgi:hypothetical protein
MIEPTKLELMLLLLQPKQQMLAWRINLLFPVVLLVEVVVVLLVEVVVVVLPPRMKKVNKITLGLNQVAVVLSHLRFLLQRFSKC